LGAASRVRVGLEMQGSQGLGAADKVGGGLEIREWKLGAEYVAANRETLVSYTSAPGRASRSEVDSKCLLPHDIAVVHMQLSGTG
jgi:hypothetical protein